MKHYLNVLILLIVASIFMGVLAGCSDVFLEENGQESEKKTRSFPYAISVEDAIENLSQFIQDEDKSYTRSKSSFNVKDVIPIKHFATRSGESIEDCDNLLYIANFENNSGYAILAADKRIPEKVLAITETGNIDGLNANAMTTPSLNNRPIFEGYPTTGPGLFTLEGYGDELFINPNTVDLFNSTLNDTMVGNFDPTLPEDDTTNTQDMVNSGNEFSTPLRITSELCRSYAARQIINYDTTMKPNPGDLPIIGTESGTVETPSLWKIKEVVNPLLSKYVYWHQGAPFNELCPMSTHFPFLWKTKKSAVGCFPLAIAKIMTYHRFPKSLNINGLNTNWKELDYIPTGRDYNYFTDIRIRMAANLLRFIGANCNSYYFYGGTFTFPSEATSFMKWMGFKRPNSKGYSWTAVKNFLNKSLPLIIYACPGINITGSHAWNIDGYRIKERTVKVQYYDENKHLIDEYEKIETVNMTHCDFGWGSTCNGYYVSGIFNNRSPEVDFDYGVNKGKDKHNFNAFIHIVSYAIPE